MTTHETRPHDEYKADLAEYTLGILDGRARAELLAHLEACEECPQELAELNAASDALLHVAPGVEPPVGFESRVVERIRMSRPTTIAARRPSRAILSIAAAIVLMSFSTGWAVDRMVTRSHPAPVVAAAGRMEQRSLVAGGQRVGRVYAYTGSPAWMFVTVDAPSAPDVVRCVVVTKSGTRQFVGTFALASGKGDWGTPLPVSFTSVRGIELTTQSGIVVAQLAGSWWSPSAGRWT
jgi:anti-sigma factor RsiW